MKFTSLLLLVSTTFGTGLSLATASFATEMNSRITSSAPTIESLEIKNYTPVNVGLPGRREGGGTR